MSDTTKPVLTDERIDILQDQYDCYGDCDAPRIHEFARAVELEVIAAIAAAQPAGEPVAWMHHYKHTKGGRRYEQADIGEHGPDPLDGFEWARKEPLYASRPAAAVAKLSDNQLLELWGPRSDGPENHEIISFARAAIAKATGSAG